MEGNICLLIRGYNMAEKRDYYEVLGLKKGGFAEKLKEMFK